MLLCHGFTGTPQSMRAWAEHLAGRGYTVRLPRLPGHGTTWQEMNRTRWQDWYAEVDAAFRELRERCDTVVVGGPVDGRRARAAAGRGARPARRRAGPGQPGVQAATTRGSVALPVLKHLVASFPAIANDIEKPGVDRAGATTAPR